MSSTFAIRWQVSRDPLSLMTCNFLWLK